MVLISPYVSYVDLLWGWMGLPGGRDVAGWCKQWDLFPGRELAREVRAEGGVLVVMGGADTVVDMGNGMELVGVMREAGVRVRGCVLDGTGHGTARRRAEDVVWAFCRGEEVEREVKVLEERWDWKEYEGKGEGED